MEVDTPENHTNLKLPILDTSMWLESNCGVTRIRHEFYKKPMSSEHVTWKRSALGKKQIRDILVQDLVRRLRNCDSSTETEVICEIISSYNYSMMIGGHLEVFRHLVCVRAVSFIMEARVRDKKGKGRLYRNKKEIEERWKKLGGRPDRSRWFRKGV